MQTRPAFELNRQGHVRTGAAAFRVQWRKTGPLLGIRPALDVDRLVGVKPNDVFGLRVEVAEKRVLPPTEVEKRHGGGRSGVDRQVSGFGGVTKETCLGPAVREE